jgi:hypothetical protein
VHIKSTGGMPLQNKQPTETRHKDLPSKAKQYPKEKKMIEEA